jgi:hypothetical protein
MSAVIVSLMPTLVNQPIGRIRVIFCAASVLVGLLASGCGSSEASSKISSTSSDGSTSAVPTPTSISTTDEAPTPLSAEELLTAKDQWGKFFKSLEQCSDVADTNCNQNAGIGSLNGSPIAATLYCDYKEYQVGQWACDWMIDFYKYSDAKWLSSGSIQSQLYDLFDGAFFAEMTGDTDSELYFSVLYTSFAEAEVHRFKNDLWSPATFDGKSILYMGYFNAKSGKMQSGVAMDMGESCNVRRWTNLIYTWDRTEFKATAGLDENNNPIPLKKALECK